MDIKWLLRIMFVSLLLMGIFFIGLSTIGCRPMREKVMDNVVQIKCTVDYPTYYHSYQTGSNGGWQGSGVFIRDDLILTAGHIVDGISDANVITIGGKVYKAKSWYLEKDADLGFIEVETPKEERALFFRRPRVGQKVWAFGNPLGVFPVLTQGIISAIDMHDDFQHTKDMIITDTAINGGNSGCPLFTGYGQIVGICSWGYRGAQGMSYFVRSEVIEASLAKYMAQKKMDSLE